MAGRLTFTHEWDDKLDLAQEWEAIARDWITWARAPDFDASPTLIAARVDMDPRGTYRVTAAGDTAFPDESFDMVVAFNSPQDADVLDPAIAEASRVLRPAGQISEVADAISRRSCSQGSATSQFRYSCVSAL